MLRLLWAVFDILNHWFMKKAFWRVMWLQNDNAYSKNQETERDSVLFVSNAF